MIAQPSLQLGLVPLVVGFKYIAHISLSETVMEEKAPELTIVTMLSLTFSTTVLPEFNLPALLNQLLAPAIFVARASDATVAKNLMMRSLA